MITIVRVILAWVVRLLTGVRMVDAQRLPSGPHVIFANHASHFDTLLTWSALPPERREQLCPVAALDYWGASAPRRFVAERILGALLIARKREPGAPEPVAQMCAKLDEGRTLLLFPEGTRSLDGRLGRFRGGLYALAEARPDVPLVPAYLENLARVLPKGEAVPLPLICALRIGGPLERVAGEPREQFLVRAREAVARLGDVAVTPGSADETQGGDTPAAGATP